MTFFRSSSIAFILALLSAGCAQDKAPAQTVPNTEAAISEIKETQTSASELHELMATSATTGSFPVATGSFINGSFSTAANAKVSHIAVKIGNYAGNADGNVSVLLCQDSNCASGERALAGSQDNQYLQIPLERSMDIIAKKPVTYRIAKVGGANQVAFWLYAPTESVPAARANDQVTLGGAPMLAIRP